MKKCDKNIIINIYKCWTLNESTLNKEKKLLTNLKEYYCSSFDVIFKIFHKFSERIKYNDYIKYLEFIYYKNNLPHFRYYDHEKTYKIIIKNYYFNGVL